MQSKEQGILSGGSPCERTTGARCRRAVWLGLFATALATVIALGILGLAPRAAAGGTPDPAAGEKTFKTNCVMCHGEDGRGTATGKALKVVDLHSDAVQKLSNAELVKAVTNGKNNMPPFKVTLKADQIQAVVAYIRQLAKQK